MSRSALIEYYLLCSAVNGPKAHFVEEVAPQTRKKMLAGPEVQLYFDESRGYVRVAESVIGGQDQHIEDQHNMGQHNRGQHIEDQDNNQNNVSIRGNNIVAHKIAII